MKLLPRNAVIHVDLLTGRIAPPHRHTFRCRTRGFAAWWEARWPLRAVWAFVVPGHCFACNWVK